MSQEVRIGSRTDEERAEAATLTVEEASKVLGISRGLAYEMVRVGSIPHLRLGKRIIIPCLALESFLKSASSQAMQPINEAITAT